MPIDRAFTLHTLTDLIRIDSRNPHLEQGAPGEWELAAYVHRVLEDVGWQAELHDLGNQRANVVATRAGTGGGPSLLINAHLDTVGVSGMQTPFAAEQRDGRIFGRGSQDTKGGMAGVLGAAKLIAQDELKLHGDLVLAFVADEEHESIGTAALLERVHTDAAIVVEPSDLDVCIAHRGFAVYQLRTRGRTAHGGRSDIGVDANLHMGRVIAALDGLRETWQQRHQHPVLGSAYLHIPVISGGRHLYVYADECTASVECRTVPGQSAEGVRADFEAILESLVGRIPAFRGSIEPVIWRPPYEIDPDRPIVRTLRAAVAAVLKKPARLISHPWWEDSGMLGEAGIETVIAGPTGDGLHTEEEWVDPDSVVDFAEILYRSILSYCGEQ